MSIIDKNDCFAAPVSRVNESFNVLKIFNKPKVLSPLKNSKLFRR